MIVSEATLYGGKEMGKEVVKLNQGDVYFIPCTLPRGARTISGHVLAKGEATGHAHVADEAIQVYELDGTLYVKGPGRVLHEEHNPILLADLTYKVGIAREVDHFNEEVRNVTD